MTTDLNTQLVSREEFAKLSEEEKIQLFDSYQKKFEIGHKRTKYRIYTVQGFRFLQYACVYKPLFLSPKEDWRYVLKDACNEQECPSTRCYYYNKEWNLLKPFSGYEVIDHEKTIYSRVVVKDVEENWIKSTDFFKSFVEKYPNIEDFFRENKKKKFGPEGYEGYEYL